MGRPDPGLDFAAALERVRGLAWRTPVVPMPDPRGDGADRAASATRTDDVWLKLESLQRTGSFKVRGAANRLLKLTGEERCRGVVAVSSGNHGRAVAEVARILGVPATICVPDWADPSKLRAIRAAGATLVRAGPSYDEAEDRAAEMAGTDGPTLVHPFDDADVIEGQGTVGLELAARLPGLREVIVPLSGGGLVAGVGLALKPRGVRVVAASARRASVMVRSLAAGRPVRVPDEDTVASALSGGSDPTTASPSTSCARWWTNTWSSRRRTSALRSGGPFGAAGWSWRAGERSDSRRWPPATGRADGPQ